MAERQGFEKDGPQADRTGCATTAKEKTGAQQQHTKIMETNSIKHDNEGTTTVHIQIIEKFSFCNL